MAILIFISNESLPTKARGEKYLTVLDQHQNGKYRH